VALAAVLEAVAADNVGIGGCDVAVATGCKGRGWGVVWGAVGRFGSVCRRLRGAAGHFDSGGEVVVAVGNGVGNRDMAVTECVGVIGHDVAGVGDGGGMKTVRQGVVWDGLRGSVNVPASLSGRSGSSWDAVCVTALTVEVDVVCVAVDDRCGSSFVCVAVSWVLDFFGVPLAFTACIILSNPSFTIRYPSSRPRSIPLSIPSFRPSSYPFIFSLSVLLHRPGPCPSASHLPRSSNSPSLTPSSTPFSRALLDFFSPSSRPFFFPTR
jgi:hypothetical protein